MADRSLRLDEIGYWSEVKLDIVRKYAAAYSRIMAAPAQARRFRGHLYIDAFAGAGIHVSKATGEMVPGSPINALNITPRFSELHLIDLEGSRAAALQQLTAEDPRVSVYRGDCNAILLNQVLPRCRYEDFRRGLCLLDPYGLTVNFQVLRTAGQMRSVDVFYNFMIMDANMNVLMRDPSKVTDAQAQRMDAVWGDDSWRTVAYRKTQDLFGDRDDKVSNEEIAEAFRLRLRDVAGFAYVPQPIPMRNSKGATVYYLYFASPNEKGADIVADIFNTYRSKGAM